MCRSSLGFFVFFFFYERYALENLFLWKFSSISFLKQEAQGGGVFLRTRVYNSELVRFLYQMSIIFVALPAGQFFFFFLYFKGALRERKKNATCNKHKTETPQKKKNK